MEGYYHTHEDLFLDRFQGDPTKGNQQTNRYGMSNLVVDKHKSLVRFHYSFNTGHGKHWFEDGKISKEGEWNYCLCFWLPSNMALQSSEDSTPLKGRYDLIKFTMEEISSLLKEI